MFTKYKKYLIIASVVLAVLVLALVAALNIEAIKGWFTPDEPDTPDDPTTTTPPAEKLFYIPFEDIGTILIENEFGKVEIVAEDFYYYVVKDLDLPVDEDTITSVVVTASDVEYTQIIAENCTDLAQYGLEKPLATFTVTDLNGNTRGFSVGNSSADGKGTYITEAGKNTVYLTNQYVSDFTIIKLASLISLEMVPQVDTEADISVLSKVRINSKTTNWQDIVLEYSEAAEEEGGTTGTAYYPYVLTDPATGFIVNGDYFENYIYKALGGITAMVAVYVDPTEAQLEECFLTDPRGELELVINGKSYNMVVSEPVNEDYCYVLMNDAIYFTYVESFVCLDATIMAIQSRFIFLDSISNFSNINVTYGGNTYRFAQKGTMFDEEDIWSVTTNGKETDGDEFKKLYTLMLSLFIDGMIADEDTLGDKMLEITYKYAGSSEEVTITYYQIDYRRCAVQFNNDPTTYYTMRKYVDKFVTALNNYLNGDTIDLYS